MPADMFVQVVDGLLERGDDSLLLVVCWKHHAQAHFRRLDVACVGCKTGFVGAPKLRLFLEVALGQPAIVPTGQLSRCGWSPGRAGGDVRLFGRGCWSWFGSNEVKKGKELPQVPVVVSREHASNKNKQQQHPQNMRTWESEAYREKTQQRQQDDAEQQGMSWCCLNPHPHRPHRASRNL